MPKPTKSTKTPTPTTTEHMAFLNARLPKALHQSVKVHCVTTGTTLMAFIYSALTEKLRRDTTARRRA